MQSMRHESFDQYGRYAFVSELRHLALPSSPQRILDVGDPFGVIAALFPADDTVSLDLFASEPPDGGHHHVIGSGLTLPFADASFDLVASHDALEHVDPDQRNAFVDEMLRVARGPVLIVAPFADPRTERCEAIVNRFFEIRSGHPLAALVEHHELGLPDLGSLTEHLERTGVEHRVLGDGWLDHWLAFYLLKAHFFGEGHLDDLHAADTFFNEHLTELDRRAPHYRRLIVLRPPAQLPDREAATGPTEDAEAGVAHLDDLADGLENALRRGVDVARPGSGLRVWLEQQQRAAGEHAEVATSLARALASLWGERPSGAVAPPPVPAHRLKPVTVVIPNFDGEGFLGPCLDSLERQDYPRELTEVIVVDNGSTDGSRRLLEQSYPWVKVIAIDHNSGFAPAVNRGVREASGRAVAFLNNDMTADPDWLSSLVRQLAPEEGAVCVGGVILSWDGERIDFAGSSMNFHGMGGQHGFGRRADTVDLVDGADLPFACGGSMLVDRATFLDVGGFDEGFFAYFEDVDLGWRLWLLGHRVVLAAGARTRHVHNGTSRRFPDHERIVLYERNALRSILKNYDDEHLRAALGPALLLLAKRATLRGNTERAAYDVASGRAPMVEIERGVIAHLHAVVDVVDDLDALLLERERIQRARRRGDEELISRFGRPMLPVMADDAYLTAQQRVSTFFDLPATFGRQQAIRVLVVADGDVGDKMRGPSIRSWELARALARTTEVILAAPGATERRADGVTVEVYEDAAALRQIADRADVILLQGYTLHRAPELAETSAVMVVDLYDPWLFENLEVHRNDPYGDRYLRIDASVQNALLDRGDFFICASERQRDYWLGMLSGRGRLSTGTYVQDDSLRSLIDVVPFGLEGREPIHAEPVLKGVHPSISERDPVVLWGGGTWDWFDPFTVLEAWPAVLERCPQAKLVFLGLELAGPDVVNMNRTRDLLRRAEELGVSGTSVLFVDWTPYDERQSYLLEADVAVSAASDLAETRLAFRSRLLDCFWARLPVVCTEGDVLSDLVADEGLGIVVPPGDADAIARALVTLLEDRDLRRECGRRSGEVATRFRWSEVVRPLHPLLREPWRWRHQRALRGRLWPPLEPAQVLLEVRDRQIASLRHEVAERDVELASLRASVAHAERRLDLLRRTPGYPMFQAIKKARRRG